jgi:hypothetical protein
MLWLIPRHTDEATITLICRLRGGAERAQCLAMKKFIDLSLAPSNYLVPFTVSCEGPRHS